MFEIHVTFRNKKTGSQTMLIITFLSLMFYNIILVYKSDKKNVSCHKTGVDVILYDLTNLSYNTKCKKDL